MGVFLQVRAVVLLAMDLPRVMVHRAIRYCVVLTMPMELLLSLEALILMLGCV